MLDHSRSLVGLGIVLLLGTASFQLTACSDSTSPRSEPGTISGTVTDAAGQPVGEVAVLVSFRPTWIDLLPSKRAAGAPDHPALATAIYSLKVTDACGDTVRTLFAGESPDPDSPMITWDGLDDAGQRVVEGLYFLVVAAEDTTLVQNFLLVHLYSDWDAATDGAHARTGADGRYTVDDACLGFGEIIAFTDEMGEVLEERAISRFIRLSVLAADGRTAFRDSVLFPSDGNLTLDFVLPD